MSVDVGHVAYHIYSARYFELSPTWHKWNKLSVADVFALREEYNFRGQNIFFWLNHPIQYVRLVGMVVQIELVALDRFVLITLDDGSGANIEIKLERRVPEGDNDAKHPSNTTLDNTDVAVQLGLPLVAIDRTTLDVGSIIRAQGTITTFRNERQLLLKRVFRVKDTNEEAIWWSQAAHWKRTVLSQPWVLTDKDRSDFDDRTSIDEARRRAKACEKRKLTEKRAGRMRRREERTEARRLQEEARFNEGALEGSSILP